MAKNPPITNGVQIPAEATQGASLNDAPPAEQRQAPTKVKLADGPSRGERGEYLPAAYPIRPGIVRVDR